jgi:excisionase family DNA binding protein
MTGVCPDCGNQACICQDVASSAAAQGIRLLKVSEAAERSGVSEWTIRAEIQRGNLRARRIGRIVRVLDEELDRWMREAS